MKPATLSPAVQTLLADLVQQLATAPLAGSVYERTTDGITYLYAKQPVGATRADIFIGRKGDPEAEQRAEQMRQGMALAKERRALIGMLRKHGLARPIRILGETLGAVAQAGLFTNGAVLVGTAAYMLYEPLVGRRLPAPTLMTGDIDLATASLALTADPPESIEAILRRVDTSFTGVPQLDPGAPSSRFRNKDGFLVDLIAPTRSRDDKNPVPLPALAAGAAPLQHLAWLIDEPVQAVALWGSGVLVSVPQPARFAVHKLILAQRRDTANRMKRGKDLDQAQALIIALEAQDPFALEDTLAEARAHGRGGWAVPIERSLGELARR